MSDEWTPSTEAVLRRFSMYPEMEWGGTIKPRREAIAQFDRWLAEHDIKVARVERQKVIEELTNCADALYALGAANQKEGEN
jgi:hypothetical protein